MTFPSSELKEDFFYCSSPLEMRRQGRCLKLATGLAPASRAHRRLCKAGIECWTGVKTGQGGVKSGKQVGSGSKKPFTSYLRLLASNGLCE